MPSGAACISASGNSGAARRRVQGFVHGGWGFASHGGVARRPRGTASGCSKGTGSQGDAASLLSSVAGFPCTQDLLFLLTQPSPAPVLVSASASESAGCSQGPGAELGAPSAASGSGDKHPGSTRPPRASLARLQVPEGLDRRRARLGDTWQGGVQKGCSWGLGKCWQVEKGEEGRAGDWENCSSPRREQGGRTGAWTPAFAFALKGLMFEVMSPYHRKTKG